MPYLNRGSKLRQFKHDAEKALKDAGVPSHASRVYIYQHTLYIDVIIKGMLVTNEMTTSDSVSQLQYIIASVSRQYRKSKNPQRED